MKKTRAPDLTEERIKVIIDILDNWNSKLTWDMLLDSVEKATGFRYSRFTFAEYAEIANAFSLKKDTLRGTRKAEGLVFLPARLGAQHSRKHEADAAQRTRRLAL